MNNKTHGVLTDAIWIAAIEYADCRVMAVKGRATDVEVADAFVGLITALNEAAPQSPVAPGDERAAFAQHITGRDDLKPHEIESVVDYNSSRWLTWQVARARLADAPTVSATDHPLTFALGVLTQIAESARQDKASGYQAGGVRWGDIESARRAVSAALNATPPTSAADAERFAYLMGVLCTDDAQAMADLLEALIPEDTNPTIDTLRGIIDRMIKGERR